MFSALKRYRRIVVSGPHRSGTTICARMIAADTGHLMVPEEWTMPVDETPMPHAECGFHFWLRDPFLRMVIQAPFHSHELHLLKREVDPDTLCVVMMYRDCAAIRRSVEAMRTRSGRITGRGIIGYGIRQYHLDPHAGDLPLPDVIYENWREQRAKIRHWREVQYESLRAHPLWKEDRRHFHFREAAA